MQIHRIVSAGLVCWMLGACSPKAVVAIKTKESPLHANEPVVVFNEDELLETNARELGIIEIKDAGLSLNCDYKAALQLAKVEARRIGANCIKIYEHRLPSALGSSCQRIKAKAYRLADISLFEKEIIWQAARMLTRGDFKGSLSNRPFAAATSSGIRYVYNKQLFAGRGTLHIETYFDCIASYFKDSVHVAETLEHEQGHFDIAEIYARLLAKAFKEKVHSLKELQQKHESIYMQIMHELLVEQDKYDSEIYTDRKKQIRWSLKIHQDLERLQEFENKDLFIPLL